MPYPDETIDSRLPYRIGCPKLPALPVKSIRPKSDIKADFEHYKKNILDIWAKYEIPMTSIVLEYRVNYDTVATNNDLTLVIVSEYSDGCQEQWIEAVKGIRAGLAQHGICWRVELIDRLVFFGIIRNFPILSTERDLIKGWGEILPDFLGIVKDQDWVSVDVLRRQSPGHTRPEPTVFISARDANDDSWDVTLSTLKQLLSAHNVKVEVAILYLKGLQIMVDDNSASYKGSPPDDLLRKWFYKDRLQMGTSCATTSNSISSGTLGGRITLQAKGCDAFELGLTNHHVVKDAFGDQGSISGPFPPVSASEPPYMSVVSPSTIDHNRVLQDLDKDVPIAKKEYEQLAQRLECLPEDDVSRPKRKKHMDWAFHEYKSAEIALEIAKENSRTIGRIYAASGFRTCENPRYRAEMVHKNWALDWCLIKIDQPKSISNQLEEVRAAYHVVKDTKVTQYCSIDAHQNYEVIKRGRTTGWTKGTISAIESVVRLDTHRTEPKVPTYQQERFETKFGGKLVFVHPIIVEETKRAPLFLERGDSGSLILLDQANCPGASIVGLGFSGNDGIFASYMMPFDLVVKDIEAVTGMKVVEPEYCGEVEGETREVASYLPEV